MQTRKGETIVQLTRNENGEFIENIYPVTKANSVLLDDNDFFIDTNLESNLKNLYKSKVDIVQISKTDQGTILQFFAQGRLKCEVPLSINDSGYLAVVRNDFERNNIPMGIRIIGMMCYVEETNRTYQLKGSKENDCWTEVFSNLILSVNTIEERDAIKSIDRRVGLLCYVSETDKTYQLKKGIENINWKEFASANMRNVSTIIERNNIAEDDRRLGMLCYVEDNNKTYQLKGGITNDNWSEFGAQGGILTVENIEERNQVNNDDRNIGMLCYVISENITYQLIGGITNECWQKFKSTTTYCGSVEPSDKDLIWIDNKDETPDDDLLQSELFDEFRHKLGDMANAIRDINYILEYKLDSGYFLEREPSWSGEPINNPLKTYTDNPYSGNVKAITLKRGNKEDFLKQEMTLMEGELAFCLDTEELYIGNKGTKRLLGKVGGGSGSGGGNVTGEYIMLETPDRQYYRLYLDNSGKLHIMHGDAYFEKAPDPSESARFKGLIINHVFAGGDLKKNVSPVTHSFIELYNNTDNKINLKGLSLQVATNGEPWIPLELVGIVNPRSSFLIRCSEITNKDVAYPRLIIDDYDMDWDIMIDPVGYKVYLTIGLAPSEYPNPSNINSNGAKATGYIDLIGVGGDQGQPIDGYENAYLNVGNTYTSVHRIDFADTDNNFLNCEAIDWNEADVSVYRPRCSNDGKWDIHYNKLKLESFKPMLINVGFGQDGNTSRTFTWQTVRTQFGYVKYRKFGEAKFKSVESKKQLIKHGDIDATGHSAIIRNLSPGIYEYKVGEEGRWSDIYTFEVQVPTDDDTINFLHVTDQQGFTEYDYIAWKEANKYIENNESYDFIINTGDISQNANKSYEWRYYYEFAKENLANHMHMTCCGNNDLINKQDPTAFTYYSTYENSPMPSVCSWDYGYIHFICLNSNIDYGFTPIDDQIEWFNNHIETVKAREKQPRWIIAYMHESPYTIVRKKSYEKFHTAFANAGVDLVLCGHHHMYSRSHGMGAFLEDGSDNVLSWGDRYEIDQIPVDPERRVLKNGGVVYIMSQATGSKLAGKVIPADDNVAHWRGNYYRDSDPSYIMFTVTQNKISMKAYKIINILPLETQYPDPPVKVERDTIEIVKS